jgi:putative transcriptional regulator
VTATGHVDELLPELVLGTLAPDERAAVEAHLEACERCAGARDAIASIFGDLALAEPPSAPPPSLRARILDETGRVSRFERFVDRVADFLDIATERARALLASFDDPAAWQPLPFPGYDVIMPEVGPRLADSQVGVLRIKPGARFPYHRHGGDEEVMLLQGGIIDDQSGIEWHPGDVQPMAKGTAHSYVGAPGPDCICIGRIWHSAIEILGDPPPKE